MRTNFVTQRNAGRFSLVLAAASLGWFLPHGACGQDAPVVLSPEPVTDAGTEKFVPRQTQLSCEGTLELRRQASVTGNQIRMRQVLRWSEADAPSFAPIADMVVDRIDGAVNRKLSLDEIRSTMRDAGVNLSLVHFAGPTSCLITRHDAPVSATPLDDRGVVRQWIEGGEKQSDSTPAIPASDTLMAPTTQPLTAVASGKELTDTECNPFHTLRDRVLIDLSERLTLPVDQLQITFDPKDRNVLNQCEPTFRFQLEPRRVRDLGKVSWDVTVMSGENQQKILLTADARAWEREVVMAKASTYKQVLRQDDVIERRVLVDRVSDDPVLTLKQVVGQQASRDLKPGTVLTARLIDPVPLARLGQFVTITLNQGGVQVKTVAKAMEAGSFGQTIKVQNELTKEVFDVTLTGPQIASMGPAPEDANLASYDRDFVH